MVGIAWKYGFMPGQSCGFKIPSNDSIHLPRAVVSPRDQMAMCQPHVVPRMRPRMSKGPIGKGPKVANLLVRIRDPMNYLAMYVPYRNGTKPVLSTVLGLLHYHSEYQAKYLDTHNVMYTVMGNSLVADLLLNQSRTLYLRISISRATCCQRLACST